MGVKLVSSSGGSVEIVAPVTASTYTQTLPANNGTILTTATAGIPISGPAFSAYNSGYQTISTATWTKLNADTENFDTNSNFASSRFTPTVAGYYQLNATILGSASATGFIGCSFYKNGSKAWTGNFIPNSNQGPSLNFTGLLYANGSTDYFEVYFYQNSGANMTAGLGDSSYGFSGSMVRSAT